MIFEFLTVTPGIISKSLELTAAPLLFLLYCQVTDMINGKGQNVYRLPPPTPCPVSSSGEPVNLRIPQTEKPIVTQVLYNLCLRITDGILFHICPYSNRKVHLWTAAN